MTFCSCFLHVALSLTFQRCVAGRYRLHLPRDQFISPKLENDTCIQKINLSGAKDR